MRRRVLRDRTPVRGEHMDGRGLAPARHKVVGGVEPFATQHLNGGGPVGVVGADLPGRCGGGQEPAAGVLGTEDDLDVLGQPGQVLFARTRDDVEGRSGPAGVAIVVPDEPHGVGGAAGNLDPHHRGFGGSLSQQTGHMQGMRGRNIRLRRRGRLRGLWGHRRGVRHTVNCLITLRGFALLASLHP